ncbi:hypothetical protein [Oribacterium sp. WCC10]|uniref:hypothetical protein n=1 Tax=Oribacterium sp. WCC10 TaxID=1855343 RepID=UPI0008EC3D35|nr:hypothetical protein [Oribacterium sp. WCC10]SFG36371.1 Putative cell wall binding repeat-containing protein [Oribacterium sp. WCC10]
MTRNKRNMITKRWKPVSIGKVALAAGAIATMMSTAALASGWSQDGDDWYYLDSSGDPVTDCWKPSDGKYYYLGSDGTMAKNTLIEDGDNYYYVGSDGAMVTNAWKAVTTDDDNYDGYAWYYFRSTGKAYTDTSSPVTIGSNKYMFDEDGQMLYGYVDENGEMIDVTEDVEGVYEAVWYFGDKDSGAMVTGWHQYEEDLQSANEDYEDYSSIWFYFKSENGKKLTDTTKIINSYRYTFDANGVMTSGWTTSTATSSSTSSSDSTTYRYSDLTSGSIKKNSWVQAIPSEEMDEDDYEDGTYRWFYTNASGYVVTSQSKKINSKWYFFDDNGIMQSGLLVLDASAISSCSSIVEDLDEDSVTAEDIYALGDESGDLNLYYFGDENSGAMKKDGTVSIELEDDTYTFYFGSNGKAYNGIKSSKYYKYGILQKASSDTYYELVEYGSTGEYVLVSKSGSVVTSGYVKDADENYYAIHSGKVAFIEADDLAAKAAAAYKAGNDTFTYSSTTYNTEDYISAEYTLYN